jgi:hypothetical protein
MGHRTLSLQLVLRALFFDPEAYDRLRDDDNPFIEGAALVVLISLVAALLNLVGTLMAWASSPSLDGIKQVVLAELQSQSWWPLVMGNAEAQAQFLRNWDLGWRIFPVLFGAANPTLSAINVVVWPIVGLISWLLYGVLVYLFSRLFRGTGTLTQTLGTTALAATPLLLRGLGLVPFLVVGGVVNTWQLICRYRAVRSAQRLPVWPAAWATILPFVAYLLFWFFVVIAAILILGSMTRR